MHKKAKNRIVFKKLIDKIASKGLFFCDILAEAVEQELVGYSTRFTNTDKCKCRFI